MNLKDYEHLSRDFGLTCFPPVPTIEINGALAQLGERNTGSVEVTGSIPVGSTICSVYSGSSY